MSTFQADTTNRSLFGALLDASRKYGSGKLILEDPERSPLSYGRLILASIVIGEKLAKETERGEAVGMLLPNVNAAAVTLFGLSALGRVAAPLNFTSGVKNLRLALAAAEIKLLVTSRRFIDTANLHDLLSGLQQREDGSDSGVKVLYLEDLRASITSLDKFIAVTVNALFANTFHQRHALGPDETAVILFTSGSEGEPKGVALSNANIIANCRQIEQHIGSPPFGPEQIFLNPLPIFHSFGLTGGMLLPLLSGMRVVMYPSPLHYRQIGRLTKETGATVLLGTDTFLQGWMKASEPEDFKSVKIVVAGAEPVRRDTREKWTAIGASVLEGYGATECSPVIAVNQIDANKPGTVGRLLPGMECRIDPVEGIQEGGRFFVRGPNVMRGYMNAKIPGAVFPPEDGWHDTGDIVTLDTDGFVAIKGRAKRFAKIGGEMVSLAAIETIACALWPDATHVAVSLPDSRKGEQVILVTDHPNAERAPLAAFAREEGYPELWTPRAVLVTAAIPVSGSGKIDLVATRELAQSMSGML